MEELLKLLEELVDQLPKDTVITAEVLSTLLFNVKLKTMVVEIDKDYQPELPNEDIDYESWGFTVDDII